MGKYEQAAQMERDIYHGRQKLNGAVDTMEEIAWAPKLFSRAPSLLRLRAKPESLRKTIPAEETPFSGG